MTRYCPTCRDEYEGEGPPYAVVHRVRPAAELDLVENVVEHLHPITREELVRLEVKLEEPAPSPTGVARILEAIVESVNGQK